MGRRKVKYTLPRLKDCKGDLTKEWYIEYSYRDEETGKLERFRVYEGINQLKSREERINHALPIIKELTTRIESGWNPIREDMVIYHNRVAYDIHARVYGSRMQSEKNLLFHINDFLAAKEVELRPKTYQDYTSKLRIFHQWLLQQGKGDIYAQEISNDLMIHYSYYLIKERKNQKETIKDSIQRISQLFNWLIKRGILNINPVYDLPQGQQTKDESAKPMMQDVASYLLHHIKERDKQLYLFCSMIFYCAIRPGTELRLLKVKDINFFTNTVTITSANAKTDAGIVNMPPTLVDILREQNIHTYDREFYVFGKWTDGNPGPEYWGKNRFRVEFNRYRDELNLPKEYKLYSWKCTGAVLFALNGAPLPAIRDHLRHKSSHTTDKYLDKVLGRQNDYVKFKFPKL